MEKILAKAARRNGGIKILIGGGDDADIDFDLAMAAQAVEGGSIQHAQELDLRLKLQFTDFIEEERALISKLEQPGLGHVGAGKRAFFVAEQLALHQVFWKSGAVDVDPRAAAPVRGPVNRAGNELLAGSSFARDEGGLSVRSNAVHHAHEPMHEGTRHNENSAVYFARNSLRRHLFLCAALRLVGAHCACFRLFFCHREQSDHPRWRGTAVTQQCNGQLRDEVFSKLGLTLASRSILTFLQNSSDHGLLQVKLCRAILRKHQGCQKFAKNFLARLAEYLEGCVVAPGDGAVKVGG